MCLEHNYEIPGTLVTDEKTFLDFQKYNGVLAGFIKEGVKAFKVNGYCRLRVAVGHVFKVSAIIKNSVTSVEIAKNLLAICVGIDKFVIIDIHNAKSMFAILPDDLMELLGYEINYLPLRDGVYDEIIGEGFNHIGQRLSNIKNILRD